MGCGIGFESISSVGDDSDVIWSIAFVVIQAIEGGRVIDLLSATTNFEFDSKDGAELGDVDIVLGDGEGDTFFEGSDLSRSKDAIEVVFEVVLGGSLAHADFTP